MYLGQFFYATRLSNIFKQQARHFASSAHVNKVSLYLQRAKLIDSIRVSLRSTSPGSLVSILNDPALDSFVVTNALRSAPSPESALFLIEKLKTVPHFAHCQNTLYTLAKILARSHQTAKLNALINAINCGKFTNVARVSFLDQMQWYAAAEDVDAVLHVWREWRASQRRLCTESYNILMSLFAKIGKNSEAVHIFGDMVDEGALPNSRTYTVIIEHLVKSGNLDLAMEIFHMLPSMRIKHTLRQYSVLVEAFTSSNQFGPVMTLFNDMQSDGILPVRAMLWPLQQMQEAGFAKETDQFIREMLPDKRIGNLKFPINCSDVDNEEDEMSNFASADNDMDGIQLKPWLDPSALASALHSWRAEDVSALEDAKIVWTARLVCKMIRSFNSTETGWHFFCWVAYQPGFVHDVYTISRMIVKLARHGRVDLVDQLMSKIKREGIRLSFSTIRLIVDFYGISGNGKAALKVFHDVKVLCGPISKSSLMFLYSSLLRTLAKGKMHSDAFSTLEEMILGGIMPDIQTFSGLMHHFALQADIKAVHRLYGMVRQNGIEPDAYMFKVLICAYCKCERPALALRVFEDMQNCNLMPDAATKKLLVKSLWKNGKLREAAAVEESCQERENDFPLSSPGHVYTVSSLDLGRVHDIYSKILVTCNS